MCTRNRLQWYVFLMSLFITMTPMHGMENYYTWNNAHRDVKIRTLTFVDDWDVQAISLTDKNNQKLIHEKLPLRALGARNKKKVFILEKLITTFADKPYCKHFSFTKAINALNRKNGIEYTVPNHLQCNVHNVPGIHNIIWNKNIDACAFVARAGLGYPSLFCAHLVEFDAVAYKEAPIKIEKQAYFHGPYFVDTDTATILSSFNDNPDVTQETSISTHEKTQRHSCITFDRENGSMPHSLSIFNAFPHLAKQCALSAKQSAEPNQRICSLSTLKLHGIPISDDYKKKIKTILVNQGKVPNKESLSNDELLSWAAFNYTYGNRDASIECCSEYKKRTTTSQLNVSIRTIGVKWKSPDLIYHSFINNGDFKSVCMQCETENSHEPLRTFLDTSYETLFRSSDEHAFLRLSLHPSPKTRCKRIALKKKFISGRPHANNITTESIDIDDNDAVTHADYQYMNSMHDSDGPFDCYKVALLLTSKNGNQDVDLYTTQVNAREASPFITGDASRSSILEKTYFIPKRYHAEMVNFAPYNPNLLIVSCKPESILNPLLLPILTINTKTDEESMTVRLDTTLFNPHNWPALTKHFFYDNQG